MVMVISKSATFPFMWFTIHLFPYKPSPTFPSSLQERKFDHILYKVMEACFVTSKPTSFPIHTRRSPTPSSLKISCCQFRSPLSGGEEDDWRSFRAKLIATQKLSTPQISSSFVDLDTVVDHPPSVSLGEKWAHVIHGPEKGCLLIATEKLDGVHIFERTVILLLNNGQLGPSGIILNRPSLMSIKETRSTALDVAGTFSEQALYFGGPLEGGVFLVSPKTNGEDGVGKSGVFEEVMKGMYYGTKESVGCAAEMVKRNLVGAEDFRFFDGYCGWEKDQLKDEIKAGYWTVAACSPNLIQMDVGNVGLWDNLLSLLGPKKVW